MHHGIPEAGPTTPAPTPTPSNIHPHLNWVPVTLKGIQWKENRQYGQESTHIHTKMADQQDSFNAKASCDVSTPRGCDSVTVLSHPRLFFF